MHWIYLIFAGLSEVGFTTCMANAARSSGIYQTIWWMGFAFFLFLSMFLLYKSTIVISLGIAYAIWTGIGSMGTVLVSALYFKEPLNLWQFFFIITLVASIVGLKIASDRL